MTGEGQRSIAAVLTDIVGNVQQIVQAEIRLAKVEVRQEADKVKRCAALLLIGGAVAVLALGFVLLSGVHALSTVVAPWIAALIVGAVSAGIGAAVIAAGVKQLQQVTIPPPRTVAAIEENLQWTNAPTK
jgi:uncharacterized membrane protein YqjE